MTIPHPAGGGPTEIEANIASAIFESEMVLFQLRLYRGRTPPERLAALASIRAKLDYVENCLRCLEELELKSRRNAAEDCGVKVDV